MPLILSTEKCHEYNDAPLWIAKLDIKDALSQIDDDIVFEHLVSRCGIEDALALARLSLGATTRLEWQAMACGSIVWRKGGRQGTVYLPSVFSLHMDETLKSATSKWKQRGFYVAIPHMRRRDASTDKEHVQPLHNMECDDNISHVVWADDIVLVATQQAHLLEMTMHTKKAAEKSKLTLDPKQDADVGLTEHPGRLHSDDAWAGHYPHRDRYPGIDGELGQASAGSSAQSRRMAGIQRPQNFSLLARSPMARKDAHVGSEGLAGPGMGVLGMDLGRGRMPGGQLTCDSTSQSHEWLAKGGGRGVRVFHEAAEAIALAIGWLPAKKLLNAAHRQWAEWV